MKLTNERLLALEAGIGKLLELVGLPVMLVYRLTGHLETIEPALKRYRGTRKKLEQDAVLLDDDGNAVQVTTDDGTPTEAVRLRPGAGRELQDRLQVLADAGVSLQLRRDIRLTELQKLMEERDKKGKPVHAIPGWIVPALRPVLRMDVELPTDEPAQDDLDDDDEDLEEEDDE